MFKFRTSFNSVNKALLITLKYVPQAYLLFCEKRIIIAAQICLKLFTSTKQIFDVVSL